MSGPCAKQTVTAVIVAPTGERFIGTNAVENPQATCPRGDLPTGVGYELCRTVCRQGAHAEVNALASAGDKARGAVLYLTGHTYACEPCKAACVAAGISRIVIGPAPDQANLAYYAGYFDGEGCVTIAGSSLSVKIANTYPEVLESIQGTFGGSISTQLPRAARFRTQYCLSLYGDAAEALLRALIPYLREKQDQAHIALLWRKLPKGEQKDAVRSALSDLKHTAHTPRKPS